MSRQHAVVHNNYVRLGTGALVRKESLDCLREVDSIILDIDGVILDVRQSFRKTISLTIQRFFRDKIKVKGRKLLVNFDDTNHFKAASGFNNDFDLTTIAALFYLVKYFKKKAETFEELKGDGVDLDRFLEKAQLYNWGYEGCYKALLHGEKAKFVDQVLAVWDKEFIINVFKELYAGTDLCHRVYGFHPSIVRKRGLMHGERTIINRDLLEDLRGHIGVYTGRIKEEAYCALQMAGLDDIILPEHVAYDDGITVKPDPKGIRLLAGKLNARHLIFLGDTPDDYRTIDNYTRLVASVVGHSDRFDSTAFPVALSGIVAKNVEDWDYYQSVNVDVLAKRTDQILHTLRYLRTKEVA